MATGYSGKANGNQSAEQNHRALSKFVPSEKLHETVRFACKRESGGVLLPNKSASNKMGIMEETSATVLAIKHPHKKLSLCSKLEVYSKTSNSISTNIMEDVFESFAQTFSGILDPGGTDLGGF